MPDDPRRGTKTAYIAKLDDLTKQVNRLGDEAVRRAVRMLLEAQREISQRVITAEGWQLSNLVSLQRQVNDIFKAFQQQYGLTYAEIQAGAYQLGMDAVDQPLKISGITLAPARLSPNVVAVLQGFSADLITKIAEEARTTINATLAQSMLGLLSPFDAQKRVAQVIGAHDKLSELTGVSARAESIFRTETGRVYSIATQARQNQVAEQVPDLEKVWVATGDARTRSGHLDAHGQHVKVADMFMVAPRRGQPKEELMHPRDPRGSPTNTIQCRCRAISWRSGYGEAVPRTTAQVDAERTRRAEGVTLAEMWL